MNASLGYLNNKSITLIGYGLSNKALGDYFIKNGIKFSVRDRERVDLPNGIVGFFGEDYLNACEDVVFRTPSLHPKLIPQGRQIFSEISFGLENVKGVKIGVTGSDGKTTTVSLINEILKKEHTSYLVGNIGAPLVSKMDKIGKDDFVVCELSSFQLYDYTPTLDACIITGITENHLDWHTSMADYVFAKRNILKKSKKAVVNYDSPYKEFFSHHNTTYFSLNDLSALAKSGVLCTYLKDGYVYYKNQRLFPIDYIKIKGQYNILNVLGALSCAIDYVSLDSIIEAVKEFEGVSHRAEAVCKINGVTFIDSSIDSTPSRSKSTLTAFENKKSVVIMGGYDKNLSYDILKDALTDAKMVVLYGENREKIYGAIKNSPQKIIIVNDIFEATRVAYREATSGDFVILSPASASFDMFKSYKERAEKFKEAIRDLENGKNKRNFRSLDE